MNLIDDGPKFSWLISFLAVVRLSGYARGADWLGVPQPTVSKRVARLESWFRRDLFTKNRPPKLTPFGRRALLKVEDYVRTMCVLRGTVPAYGEGVVLSREEEIIRALLFPAQIL